jgi:drug/metabolite transporter (DMT)-like permease
MTNHKKGLLLVTGTAVISGISIFINSYSVKMVAPAPFTFLKNSIVAIALVGIILALGQIKKLKKLDKNQWFYLLVIGFVGGFVPFLLFFNGLSQISGATGSFLHKTMFVFVAILAPFFLKEKNHRFFLPAAALLLIGNFLLLKTDFSTFGIGHLLVIAATILWALENVISKQTLQNMDGTVLAAGRMFFGSIFLLTYLIITNQIQPVLSMTGEQWLWTAIPTALLLGYVLTWYNGLKFVPATIATSILLLGAPITLLLDTAILQKPVVINQWLGLISTLTGAMLIATFFWYDRKFRGADAKPGFRD